MPQISLDNLKITAVGRLMYYLVPLRKRIIMKNIERVFKCHSKQEKMNLAKAFYSHFLTTLKEIISIRWCNHDKLREGIEIEGLEHLLSAHAQQRGVILLCAHVGNWEYAPLLGFPTIAALSGRFYFVRRAIRIKWLQKILFQRFQKANLAIIDSRDMFKHARKLLRDNNVLVFTFDQHASIDGRHGIAVDFFGSKAGTYKTLAFLAGKTGALVVPGATYRLNKKHHVLQFYPALVWKENEDWEQALHDNTRIYNQAIEQFILANPAQWLWPHRRWKLDDLEKSG
ncbi:lipid A biosynthesis lauroyl acyltransferase [Legionella taurinensis]|uniref:Lipid A biosynthesis lauroyl acyltransferase n=1 Tax=Legionella taurinensis TaxID=70611 RepID=A0A3A5L340_9GAMM|nr:lysophospholipid acyltransferase family protein [Legionella taurinensis]MDX1836273.1 lysophospholipid acyltransferase family protein [Legionella taurinensis]PUT41969.1 lipid A biosynthesis lauroyl acyltransferase [Legionella taurinensis]PUT44758.1 lipid A biosynthesis lauroyl acyltransferase [Legionella taurinensis]PUT48078.1 lipid A biosynthesis lauroyl acyltransferase [Legionella taurinensis]PUT48893.1 lipid A biosynthesis lauroyl acyltransferase [Legionella taurinensis]